MKKLKFDLKHFLSLKNKNNETNKGKVTGIILIAALLAGSIFYISSNKSTNDANIKINVTADTIRKESINIKASFIGKIRTSESVILSSEVVGKITFMKKDGSMVEKGDLIIELDSTEAEGKYMIALGKKEEEELKLHSTESLFKENYRTLTHIKEQKARFQTAQGHLMEAIAYLNKHKIRAPFVLLHFLELQSHHFLSQCSIQLYPFVQEKLLLYLLCLALNMLLLLLH